jgi:hypothetical protein
MSVLDSDFIYDILPYKLISSIVSRTTNIEQRKSKKNQGITFKILSKRIPLEPLIKIDWFSKGFFFRYSSKS